MIYDEIDLESRLKRCFFKGSSGSTEVKETAQEKAAAEIALNRYNRYLEVYRPIESQTFGDVTGDASAKALERKAGGMIGADSAQALNSANNNIAYADPSHGAIQNQDPARAKQIADAAGQAAGLGRKQKIAGLQGAVNIGTGQANHTELAFDDMAGSALQENITNAETAFNAKAARTNAIASGVGALAGIGMNSFKNPNAPMQGYTSDGVLQSGTGGIKNTWSPTGRR